MIPDWSMVLTILPGKITDRQTTDDTNLDDNWIELINTTDNITDYTIKNTNW